MPFEQNQQDQFNMNNGIDQLKQFKAELDKATASIGAAELEAEEELLGIRLKNLSKAQQTKLTQLGQMLELEEKGIQELAKLKLTLSNRQFAVRKKEIQKEFQEYKAAADEFFKAENKRKSTKAPTSTSKTTEDLKASNKSNKATDAAIQKASKKVQSAIYGVNKVYQDVGDAIASLQEVASENQKLQRETKKFVENTAKANTARVNTSNTTENNVDNTELKVQEERPFSDKGLGSEDKVDLEKFGFESITGAIDQLRAVKDTDVSSIISALESIKDIGDEKGKENVSQLTLDLTEELMARVEESIKAEEELNEFRKDAETLALNRRLLALTQEQAYRKKYLAEYEEFAKDGFNHLVENMSAEAYAAMKAETEAIEKAIANRSKIAADNEKALAIIRNKGTLEEKKQQLKALVKQRAAEKDWSTAGKNNKKEASEFSKKFSETLQKSPLIKGISDKAKETKNKVQDKLLETKLGQGLSDKFNKFSDKINKYRDFEEIQITDKMSDDEKQSAEEHNKQVQKNKEIMAGAELALNAATQALSDFAQKLSGKADEIAKVQGVLDTRLQGSKANDKYLLSYGKQLQKDAKFIAAVSPYMSQEKLVENIQALVNKGISFDIKQRAFLMTIQEKIANTFDVADGTLLRLIRIQQQDTTAGRLGMESALNSFLNSMYETSEYLESVAGSVRGSLEEMQALMEGKAATEIEYQVQKWMGSLYSVGMSDAVVQDIAKTFGQVASGDIGGIANGGTGNLLIMAANEAGLSIADILQDGLNADDTNKLMQAMVNYLAEIAEASSDSRVVQQQLANVYGLKASDLRAATNLSSSLNDVSKANMSYGKMMGQLNLMMNTLALRTSLGEGVTNMWNNLEYTMASSMAANPIAYILPKMAKMLKETTGGIALPFVNVMGFGVDLNTTVADLMNVAALAPTVLGSLGSVLAGLSDLTNPLAGTAMLNRAEINPFGSVPVIARGSAPALQALGGSSVSESGLVGNASSDDIKNATLQGAEDDKKKQMVEAKEDESDSDLATRSQQAVIDIYSLLEEVVHGSLSLRVRLVMNNNGFFETDNGNWVLSI